MMNSQRTPLSGRVKGPLTLVVLLAGVVAFFTAAGPAAAHRSAPTGHHVAALPGNGAVKIVGVSIRVTKDTDIDDTLTSVQVTEHQSGAFVLAAGAPRPQRNSTLFVAQIVGGIDTRVRYTPPPDHGEPETCRWHDEPHGQLQVGLHQVGNHYEAIFVPVLRSPNHECGQYNSIDELLIDDVNVPESLVSQDRFSITAHGTKRINVRESTFTWTARITFARVRGTAAF